MSRGYPVFTFNQRSVPEILQMIRILGGIVGVADKAEALASRLERDLETIRARREHLAGAAAGLLRGMGRAA